MAKAGSFTQLESTGMDGRVGEMQNKAIAQPAWLQLGLSLAWQQRITTTAKIKHQ